MDVMKKVLQNTMDKYYKLKNDPNLHESFKKELSLVKCMKILEFQTLGNQK